MRALRAIFFYPRRGAMPSDIIDGRERALICVDVERHVDDILIAVTSLLRYTLCAMARRECVIHHIY